MTQENQISKNTILDAFLKQRAKRQNSAIVEARKLVNLYRQLSLFGDDFLDSYNQMLLDAMPEVQMALPDIVGGAVVRQYLEFLKGRAKQSDTDAISEEAAVDAYQYRHAESYLPTPDEVPPFAMNAPLYQAGNGEGNVDTTALTAQMRAFERALEQQNAFLTQALTQLQQNMINGRSVNAEGQAIDMSAVAQSQKDILSELLTRQNEQMNANINAILSQTQELSARQMAVLEKLIQKQSAPDPYAVIEEDAQVVSQTSIATSKPSYTSRYRSEEPAVLHQTEVELEPVTEHKEDILVNEVVEPKRYSSVSLNDYYAEQDETLAKTTTPDWKG